MKPRNKVYFGQPVVDTTNKLLRECFDDLNSGDPTRIARWNADPYGDEAITPEIADQVIDWLDKRMNREIDEFPSYHSRRSGADRHPEWYRLPAAARLGLAQRLAAHLRQFPEQ